MCGRINMSLDPADLVDELDIGSNNFPYEERYNVPPGSVLPIIVDRPASSGEIIRRLEPARWGLVPGWAKDLAIGYRAFNARSETVHAKPMFRAAFKSRRCILPVPAYYEWVAGPEGKQPWMMSAADSPFLFMAGLFEFKQLTEGEAGGGAGAVTDNWLVSTTILTAPATGHLAEVHDRMPVMVPFAEMESWIDPGTEDPREELEGMLDRIDPEQVVKHRVGTAVGNVRNEGPALAERLQ